MIISITSIKLKSPLKFFILSYNGMQIMKQLKTTNCQANKTKGFWKMHYTMTLWENENQVMDFVKSDAHLAAMKISKTIAQEIRTVSYNGDKLPDWKTGIDQLKKGKVISY